MAHNIKKVPLTGQSFLAIQKVLAAADQLRNLEQRYGFTAKQAQKAIDANAAYWKLHPNRTPRNRRILNPNPIIDAAE
jgi:hypothetical protein